MISLGQLTNQLPGAVGAKDKDSVYIAGNDALARYMGYKNSGEIEGLSDVDIKSDLAELAPQFVQQDAEVMQTGRQQHIDIGYYTGGDLQIHFSTKKPLLDDSGKVAGTIFTCMELGDGFLKKIYQGLMQPKLPAFFRVGSQYEQYDLSRRESQCLFYLIRGLTAKETASRIHLSSKTIESYIDRLKNKFRCSNKSALIEKAIGLGFLFNIPLDL